jgi:GTP-binding protein HflX
VSDDIEKVRKRREQLRRRRHKTEVPMVALVGYTNAGKTTLFNVLTRAEAEASNALFVTLDPLVRQVRLPDSRELLMSDTVGFIDRLPHALVAAFRATLEELVDADLVLHVIDASAPDRDRRMNAVRQVLDEIGAGPGGRSPRSDKDVSMIDVYNKCDAVTVDEKRRLQEQDPSAVRISAVTREGLDELLDTITSRLALDVQRVTLTFDPDDAADRDRMARLYRHGTVIQHETRDDRVAIVADVPRRLVPHLERP